MKRGNKKLGTIDEPENSGILFPPRKVGLREGRSAAAAASLPSFDSKENTNTI